jgi:TolB-like protein
LAEDFAEKLIYPSRGPDNFLRNHRGTGPPGSQIVEFAFGDRILDTARRELRRGAELVAIQPQVFDLLVYLMQNRERVVSKDDLVRDVWGGRIVSDSTLTSRINAVRKAVGDHGRAQRLIRTMPRKGIRFVGAVWEEKASALPETSPMSNGPPPRPAPALPDVPSIAVLPFVNMSGDPDQEYFADGIVEDITTRLSRSRSLFVIARNSTSTYKGKAVDAKQAGQELGVRYLLEGSVRKAGNRLRITTQLIEAAAGSHIWADRYDREIVDIFAVQDEIAERVVATVEPQLYAAEYLRSRPKPPERLDAWECVIRALSEMEWGTIRGVEAAEELCRRAIVLAPDYARARSLLAWALILRAIIGGGVAGAVPQAMSEVQKAIALDEQDALAHVVLGMVHWRRRRYPESESAFRRAIALNPNFAAAHASLAFPLALQGNPDAAVASAEHAMRLNPGDLFLGYFATSALTVAHFAAGRYTEAVAWTRKTIEKRPDYPRSYALLMAAAGMAGDLEAAAEALAVHRRLVPYHSLAWERENMPFAGEYAERFLEGLRRAGVPEE